MNPDRKAEVNRRLDEFEGTLELTLSLKELQPADYTTDLNALARLEAKLPPHHWCSVGAGYIWEMWSSDDGFMGGGTEQTEAEARAEAICLYLESKAVK